MVSFETIKAWGLLQKKKSLFSLSTSNALLEFLLEGAPQVREHLRGMHIDIDIDSAAGSRETSCIGNVSHFLDSRRLADRQLKSTCEAFIDYCGDHLVGPVRVFIFKVEETRWRLQSI